MFAAIPFFLLGISSKVLEGPVLFFLHILGPKFPDQKYIYVILGMDLEGLAHPFSFRFLSVYIYGSVEGVSCYVPQME